MTPDAVIIQYALDNPDVSIKSMTKTLNSSSARIAKLLYGNGIREPRNTANVKCSNDSFWLPIKKELDTTDASLLDIANKHSTTCTTILKSIRANRYPYEARKQRIYAKTTRVGSIERNWPAVEKILDTTELKLVQVASKFGVSYRILRRVINEKGYDTQQRRKRLRSSGPAYGGRKPIHPIEPKETLSGDKCSLLAHRLPLNRIHEVYGHNG